MRSDVDAETAEDAEEVDALRAAPWSADSGTLVTRSE